MGTRIIIIGAGYAGLMAAVRLANKTRGTDATITLVNGAELFVERIRSHQIAANQPLKQHSIPTILQGTNIGFLRGWVKALQPNNRTVTIQTEHGLQQLEYDTLIFALGSATNRQAVPGVRDYAYTLNASGDMAVEALREKLPELNKTGGRLLICGGGATGIEAAAEFADTFPNLKIHLVTGEQFGAFTKPKVAQYMLRSLKKLNVVVEDHTPIIELQDGQAVTKGGTTIPFDVCLWTGGFIAPTLAREAGLAVNERNQILTDPFLRSVSHPEIYAVGDSAQPVEEPGTPIRMSVFVALVTGGYVAESLALTLHGKQPQPLSFAWYGQAIALGHHDAIGFFTYPADKPIAPYFTGRGGYLFREFFATFASSVPRLERRIPGIFNWQGKGRYLAQQKSKQLQKVGQSA